MHYQVRLVKDSQLPSEVEFAFVCLDDETYLFVKQSAINPATGECNLLTRSFNTWERAQSVQLKELAGAH